MKAIEDIARPTLFERASAGMRITMAGEAALATAGRLADETRLLGERMAAIRAGASGRLAVATVSTAKYFAPRLIAAFRQEHPDVESPLLFGNRAETIDALHGLHAEIALMGRPPRGVPTDHAILGPHPMS